jgi:flavorubredoxin
LLGAAELALQPLLDDPQRLAGPADVRWIWLTHPDRDHTGALFDLLEAAPQARLVTTFLGAGILSTQWPLPLDRVYLLNPGQSLEVGDRTLTASGRRCTTAPSSWCPR